MASTDKIKVTIIDQANGRRTSAILPTNVTVERLLPHVIKALALPLQGPGGAPVRYDLSHETSDGLRRLPESQTLADIGVQEGSTLRITPEMRAGAQKRASKVRYFKLRLTNMEDSSLFETDFLVDQFELFVRQLAAGLVQQRVFRPDEYYNARIIPRVDNNPDFGKATVLKGTDTPSGGYGFLDILFEQVEPPVDRITYLTLQLHSIESNSAYRWDLRLDTYLGGLLTRVAQVLLDDGVLKDGDRFRFFVSAHDMGRPRIDPVAVVQKPPTPSSAQLVEQDVGEIKVLPDGTQPMTPAKLEDDEIEITIGPIEELITPGSKSMASYTDKETMGQVSETDIPIFLKRSARDQAFKSATNSIEAFEEVGGFLLGNVFRDPENDRLFVEISEALEADEAKGTAVSLDFNYGAWRQVLDRLDQDFPAMIPVGWYHTHLISQAVVLPVEGAENEYIARYSPFFSQPDLFIHRNFFPDPWHVALVIDLRCRYDLFFAWREGMIAPTTGFYVYGD